MIRRFLIALAALAFAGSAWAQQVHVSPIISPYTPPNVSVSCGSDGTAAIQAALNNAASNNGAVSLPPCPQTNPILISATLNIPSNTALKGMGRGVTWLQEAASANLQPMIQNSNAGGGANLVLDSNIRVSDLSIDGNGAAQTNTVLNRCMTFIGVFNISIIDVEIKNCRSDAVTLNGNSAPFDGSAPFLAGARTAFIDKLYINGVIGPAAANGWGLGVQNRQRGVVVSNVDVEDSAGNGVFIDASDGVWNNIYVKGAGFGTANGGALCSSSSTTTADNPGGGVAGQYAWVPCPVGIYIHNVTNVSATNLIATYGRYHGVVIVGARNTAINGIVSTNNSQRTLGVWDDLHIDYNSAVGYGENHKLVINGVQLGANSQSGSDSNSINAPTVRYGLFVNDGQAGSIGDATISNAGTGYGVGNTLTISGGTQTETGRFQVVTAPGGIIGTLDVLSTAGTGTYTVLPTNPVSLTGGTGASAAVNINWSTASLTGISIGQTLTAAARIPAFHTGWTIQTNAQSADATGLPTLSSCGGGSPAMTAASTNFEGSLTVGTATGTCTMTFATSATGTAGFTTIKKCIVTSRTTLAAFAYACTTTGITITATTLGGDVVDYEVDAQ